jgi:aspartate kinase
VLRLIENPEMSGAVEGVVRRLNLSGLHGFDFMLEADTENAYLIEINPRATQVGHLRLGLGRDLPAALYAAISGEAIREAPKVTENKTITLFPQEWVRDPASAFLQSGYHDVPWDEPEFVRACVASRSKKSAWYSRSNRKQVVSTKRSPHPMTAPAKSRTVELQSGVKYVHMNRQASSIVRNPLRIMKFGGTSVGDVSSIQKVVEIIRGDSRESDLVVVVSAMSGVTNKLIEAATHAEAGSLELAGSIFRELRQQHEAAVHALIDSPAERDRMTREMEQVFQEGDRLVQRGSSLHELTLRARDSISCLGERLSAPLIAAALRSQRMASEAIAATEIVVTNSCHGGADPDMDLTRARCQARLRPLLQQNIIPIVTGFIGATAQGVLTTLGRGGSDYSATILGAALDADEVVIWTDVDGLMTGDPRLVSDSRTIEEISYHAATELAHFGAKVLHPKTLRPVMPCGIPLWIRNTFEPERHGTKITPTGPSRNEEMRAVAAINDAALITLAGPCIVKRADVLARISATLASIQAEAQLMCPSSSQNGICLVVSSSDAKRTVKALRAEFAADLVQGTVQDVILDPKVAIVTVVGQNLRDASRIVESAFEVLVREKIDIIAIAHDSSQRNLSLSFAVSKQDMRTAVNSLHRDLHLGAQDSQALPTVAPNSQPLAWLYDSARTTVDGA